MNNHSVELTINNKTIDSGNTKNVMDNPLNSAIWLVNKLASQGIPLLKGQYLSTGTCTKAMPIYKGSNIKASFGTLGNVEFDYI